ncbi:NAD(P)H-hydrate dehydratase [Flavobacterium sp. MFBS3-15]|uniref:NAD(P)H-hydrate dehydratase n=1 Tax=Flavobacterium sp. MFBS3-15 TaxID=2989816 RepID=UPI0022364F93|nr:NAD(P)H-hydrate dehydratase [Flavobacterium sp. MFBS3-15]MCW4468793.1 NAD(P)H-hydrate dehydratase [Flavobacterium sp. MFBS3-15]
MKIFDAIKIREADETTISRQGITSGELMERAGSEVFLWLKRKFPDKETVFHIFCGKGNNGGDGLVVARLLHKDNYKAVVDIVEGTGTPSPDFSDNLDKLSECGLACNTNEVYEYKKHKIVYLDAVFGIGLNREVGEEVRAVIEKINNSGAKVISIDVPSGMFMDRKTELAVQSDIVLTFQFPKLAFYLAGNCRFIKEIEILDIGLDKEFIGSEATHYHLTDKAEAHRRYRPVPHHAHKGTQGHALIIGGSYGKMGAALLSAKAALRSGCGLVTAYIPKCGYNILQTAFPEAMALTDGEEQITNISFDFKPKAIGLGMGMGQHPETQQALLELLKKQQSPLVIDADALNIVSYNKEWLAHFPENTILTPHPKELERLIGPWGDDFEKVEKIRAFAKENNIILVAKDAFTLIAFDDVVYINPTGNSGLATGGSGDVLTGIITGLLAQSYPPADAAIFGVYLHGLAADIGVCDVSRQAFTASDIIYYLGKAYLTIEAEKAQK